MNRPVYDSDLSDAEWQQIEPLPGNRRNQGNASGNLGLVYTLVGNYSKAIECYQQHLRIAQEIRDRRGEGIAQVNMGWVYILAEQFSAALENNNTALKIFHEIGDRANTAEALRNLTKIHQELGEIEVAQQLAITQKRTDQYRAW